MQLSQMRYSIPHSQAMEQLGTALAHAEGTYPVTIFLRGNLGAGKTTLVRGFLQGLGYTHAVKSPTFSLVEVYELMDHTVVHFDLYRLNNPHELENIGWYDYLNGKNTCLIEWPENAGSHLPPVDIDIEFHIVDQTRKVELKAKSAIGETILKRLNYTHD